MNVKVVQRKETAIPHNLIEIQVVRNCLWWRHNYTREYQIKNTSIETEW